MPKWLEKRTLGTVYWVEAPALYVLFLLAAYGLWAVLKSQGADETALRNAFLSVMGVGTFVVSGYVWLASNNTTTRMFAVLAKLSALIFVGLYLSTVIWGIK